MMATRTYYIDAGEEGYLDTSLEIVRDHAMQYIASSGVTEVTVYTSSSHHIEVGRVVYDPRGKWIFWWIQKGCVDRPIRRNGSIRRFF